MAKADDEKSFRFDAGWSRLLVAILAPVIAAAGTIAVLRVDVADAKAGVASLAVEQSSFRSAIQTGADCNARQDKALDGLVVMDTDLRAENRMMADDMSVLRTDQRVTDERFKAVERRLTNIEDGQRAMNAKLDQLLQRPMRP